MGTGLECPAHVARPDPPGPCPTAPPSMASTGEIPIITAVPGGQLLLECPEGAEPHPSIEWHREGSLLQVPVTGPGTVTVRAWPLSHCHQQHGLVLGVVLGGC